MKLRDYLDSTDETQKGLASKLEKLRGKSVTQGLVSQWLNDVTAIEAGWVIPIYSVTNGEVRPFDVRPDIYPDPNWLPTEEQVTSALAA
ncbi:MAG: YdaS family helix-turn-helix protein [Candidatus Sedimenticola sp. (ex Thyasira tokunagai)]